MISSIRLPFSLLLALAINLLLFLAIQKLVQPDHDLKSLPEMVTMVDFVRLKKDEKIVEPKREILPEIPKPPEQEPPPKPKQQVQEKPKPQKVELPTPDVKLPLDMTKGPHLGEFVKKTKPKPVIKQKVAPIPKPVKKVHVEPVAEPVKESVAEPVQEPPKPVQATKPAQSTESTIDTDVQATYKSKPKYPTRALRAGMNGVVTVEFTITAQGRVTDPVIIKATPPNIFDKSVLRSIKRWKFEPRIVNGKPVARRARQDIKFDLK